MHAGAADAPPARRRPPLRGPARACARHGPTRPPAWGLGHVMDVSWTRARRGPTRLLGDEPVEDASRRCLRKCLRKCLRDVLLGDEPVEDAQDSARVKQPVRVQLANQPHQAAAPPRLLGGVEVDAGPVDDQAQRLTSARSRLNLGSISVGGGWRTIASTAPSTTRSTAASWNGSKCEQTVASSGMAWKRTSAADSAAAANQRPTSGSSRQGSLRSCRTTTSACVRRVS